MNESSSQPRHKPAKHLSGKTVKSKGDSEKTLRARIWIDLGGETYLAPGRVTLLERIAEYGSISRAAKSMEMSYRHAWLLVDDMNNKADRPLVVRASGGKGGGGTSLTSAGEEAVFEFNEMQYKLQKFIKKLGK
jgi:molybdate transport system regulatory protein